MPVLWFAINWIRNQWFHNCSVFPVVIALYFVLLIAMYIRNPKSYYILIKFECVWVSTEADWNLGWISWVAVKLIIRKLPENKEESYLHLEHWKVSLGETSGVYLFVSTCTVAVLMRYLKKLTFSFPGNYNHNSESEIANSPQASCLQELTVTGARSSVSVLTCVGKVNWGCNSHSVQHVPTAIQFSDTCRRGCFESRTKWVQWNVGVCFTESMRVTLKNVKRNFLP